MNIREKLINDINSRAQIKLAGFAEIQPYLSNALLGGATLSAFTALPALLHSYSSDEDPLKVLAEVTKYSMPIGALMGAGATGASRLSTALSSAVDNFGNKTLQAMDIFGDKAVQAVDKFTAGAKDIANDAVNALAKSIGSVSDSIGSITRSIGPTADTLKELLEEAASTPADIMSSLA